MKNLIQYRYTFEELFFKYLKGQISLFLLEGVMQALQLDHQMQVDDYTKELWFKFSKDDTGATDIRELVSDLNNPVNREYRLEQMKACIDLNAGLNGTELYIYFS